MEFFKKIGIKVKVIFGAITGFLGVVLFFFVRSKIQARDKLEFELERVKSEMEIARLDEKSEESLKKIEELHAEEGKIKDKIRFVEEKEIKGEKVSIEELDRFFNERGF
jgi:hypothetical protein